MNDLEMERVARAIHAARSDWDMVRIARAALTQEKQT